MKNSLSLLFFLLLLFSCEKHLQQPSIVSPIEFDAAKMDQQYKDQIASGRQKGNNKSTEKKIKKKLRWNGNLVAKKGDESVLIVPFSMEEELYSKTPNGLTLPYGYTSRLLVYVKNGKYEYEVVTRFFDKNDLSATDASQFTGMVIVEDINGNFKKGFRYTKDGVISLSQNTAGGRTNTETICHYVDWFSCSVRNENGIPIYEYCQFMYSELKGCETVEDLNQDFFVQWDGRWYFNFGGPGTLTPQEVRVIGETAPLDRVCSSSFNYAGNQSTSINYQTGLKNLRFEDGVTANVTASDAGLQFFLPNRISDAAMQNQVGWAAIFGFGPSRVDNLNRYFPYLLGSGDIQKVWSASENMYVWTFSPTAVKAISAYVVNEAQHAVAESMFGMAATSGNEEAFRKVGEFAGDMIVNLMPGARIKYTRFLQAPYSYTTYATNCK